MAEEIAKLEAELDSRHDQEIADIKNSSGDTKEVFSLSINQTIIILIIISLTNFQYFVVFYCRLRN